MTPEQIAAEIILKETEDYVSEYSEMTDNPSRFVARVLAANMVRLFKHIDYLESRLEYVSKNTISRHSGMAKLAEKSHNKHGRQFYSWN